MSRLLKRAAIAFVIVLAADGTMPGTAWTLVRPEAQLSTQDIETICAAARGDR